MYGTIIVPLNGACAGEQAIPLARDEACRHQAGIVLLRVIPRPEHPRPDPRVRCSGPRITAAWVRDTKAVTAMQTSQDYLDDVRRRYALPEDTAMRVVIGEPVTRILAEAEQWPQPLMVMTTGDTQPTLSDVTRRVLIRATVPVMVSHARAQVTPIHTPDVPRASLQPRELVIVS